MSLPKRTVWLVDDDPDIGAIVKLALVRVAGWQVIEAASAAACLALPQTPTPDLILLDVGLPDLSGPELLLRLRQQPALAKIAVVFFTALQDLPADARREAAGFVAKPFDPLQLAQQLEAIFQAHRQGCGA